MLVKTVVLAGGAKSVAKLETDLGRGARTPSHNAEGTVNKLGIGRFQEEVCCPEWPLQNSTEECMGAWAKPSHHRLQQERKEGLGLGKVVALHFRAKIGRDTATPSPRLCLIKRGSSP